MKRGKDVTDGERRQKMRGNGAIDGRKRGKKRKGCDWQRKEMRREKDVTGG